MKKEIGKWFMDIAKYITTAVVLSSIFGVIEKEWLVVTLGVFTATVTFVTGVYLIKDYKER